MTKNYDYSDKPLRKNISELMLNGFLSVYFFALFCAVFVCLIIFYIGIENFLQTENDYIFYYIPVQFLQKFSLVELYDVSNFFDYSTQYFPTVTFGGWFYPPHYILHIYLFGLFSYGISKVLFVLTGVVLFLVAIYLCQPKNNFYTYLLIIPSVFLLIITSQNSLYTASYLLLGLHFLDKKPIISGLFLALLTYKPPFFIVLPFVLLFLRYKKVFLYIFIFFALQVIASLIMFGIKPWIAFINTGNTIFELLTKNFLPICLMSTSFTLFIKIGFSLENAKLLSSIWFIIISAITLYIFYIRRADNLARAILVSGVCLATPYMFFYDVALLIIPILFYMWYKEFLLTALEKNIFFLMFIIHFLVVFLLNIDISMIHKLGLFSYLVYIHKITAYKK
jgi:hypothetical protein